MRPDPDYHMGFARHAATKSKDSTKVGAALVGPDGEVRLTSFNGIPRGVNDYGHRYERPTKYLFCQHAERNLISFAARYGIRSEGCAVYSTHFPCAQCAGAMIQAGIGCVVCGPGEWQSQTSEDREAALDMMLEAKVTIVELK